MSLEESAKVEKRKLKHPIEIIQEGGGKYLLEEVTIGRLKAKHLRLLPPGFSDPSRMEPSLMIPLVSASLGLPETVVDEMDLEDLMFFIEVMTSFFAPSPPQQTGKKLSGQ